MTDIFRGAGIEISLPHPDDFLKIKETLTRIGIASRKEKHLYQSCHILHKQSRYAIVHFKELFGLDGKETNFSEDDRGRRNTIVNLLAEWNLLEIIDPDQSKLKPLAALTQIKIVSFKEKTSWVLESKYNIGRKK
jgi:hypothetical protein